MAQQRLAVCLAFMLVLGFFVSPAQAGGSVIWIAHCQNDQQTDPLSWPSQERFFRDRNFLNWDVAAGGNGQFRFTMVAGVPYTLNSWHRGRKDAPWIHTGVPGRSRPAGRSHAWTYSYRIGDEYEEFLFQLVPDNLNARFGATLVLNTSHCERPKPQRPPAARQGRCPPGQHEVLGVLGQSSCM